MSQLMGCIIADPLTWRDPRLEPVANVKAGSFRVWNDWYKYEIEMTRYISVRADHSVAGVLFGGYNQVSTTQHLYTNSLEGVLPLTAVVVPSFGELRMRQTEGTISLSGGKMRVDIRYPTEEGGKKLTVEWGFNGEYILKVPPGGGKDISPERSPAHPPVVAPPDRASDTDANQELGSSQFSLIYCFSHR